MREYANICGHADRCASERSGAWPSLIGTLKGAFFYIPTNRNGDGGEVDKTPCYILHNAQLVSHNGAYPRPKVDYSYQ